MNMKKFFVYYLERLYREESGDQITLLFDCRCVIYFYLILKLNHPLYRDAGLKNMDMEFVQFIIGTLKEFYPDPLNYILVLEMPWVLNGKCFQSRKRLYNLKCPFVRSSVCPS